MNNFFKPGELVVDELSGTLATTEPCLEPPRHPCFVHCDENAELFAACTKALVETYIGHVLNEKSNNSGTNEVMNTCKKVV